MEHLREEIEQIGILRQVVSYHFVSLGVRFDMHPNFVKQAKTVSGFLKIQIK